MVGASQGDGPRDGVLVVILVPLFWGRVSTKIDVMKKGLVPTYSKRSTGGPSIAHFELGCLLLLLQDQPTLATTFIWPPGACSLKSHVSMRRGLVLS